MTREEIMQKAFDAIVEADEDMAAEVIEEGKAEGVQNTLLSLAKDGIISVQEAAKRAKMPESDFRNLLKQG